MSSHPSLRPTWTLAGNLQTVLLGLASGGVCLAAASPRRRCALTAPFQPCRPALARARLGRCVFCGTFPRVSPGRRYRPPCPVMSGLSSKGDTSAAARPARQKVPVVKVCVNDHQYTSDRRTDWHHMYDVIYIDAHGCETPVAQHLDDRRTPRRSRGRPPPSAAPAGWSSPARASCPTASASCRSPRRPQARVAAPRAVAARALASSPPMRVGVIGGGLMGSGIAEVCARSGVDVTVVEVDDERAERSRAAIEKSLDRARPLRQARARTTATRPSSASPSPRARGPRGRRRRDRGVDRGRAGSSATLFRRLDELLPDARLPRLQHLVGADHEARRRDQAARPRARHALLQPGAGAAAGRARARRS